MTIRHKRITVDRFGRGPAHEIAKAISTKAFEHLLVPVEKAEHELALRCYLLILKKCGTDEKTVQKMEKMNLVELSDNAAVTVIDTSGNEARISTYFDGSAERFVCGRWSTPLTLEQNDLYDEATEVLKRKNELLGKRSDLCITLMDQLTNRSTKEAMAEWPEAAGIIAEVMHLDVPPMIKPLEQLLVKFLPMLPAPK